MYLQAEWKMMWIQIGATEPADLALHHFLKKKKG